MHVLVVPRPPISMWENIYWVLTAHHWPNFPFTISAFVVTLGTFLALAALLWRQKPLSNVPLSLGIMLLGLMAPYLFYASYAYPPRFSIHLLPLAILSFMIILNNLFSNSSYSKSSSENMAVSFNQPPLQKKPKSDLPTEKW